MGLTNTEIIISLVSITVALIFILFVVLAMSKPKHNNVKKEAIDFFTEADDEEDDEDDEDDEEVRKQLKQIKKNKSRNKRK